MIEYTHIVFLKRDLRSDGNLVDTWKSHILDRLERLKYYSLEFYPAILISIENNEQEELLYTLELDYKNRVEIAKNK